VRSLKTEVERSEKSVRVEIAAAMGKKTGVRKFHVYMKAHRAEVLVPPPRKFMEKLVLVPVSSEALALDWWKQNHFAQKWKSQGQAIGRSIMRR
jgi:hypothetical protein